MIKLIAITDSEFGISKDGGIPWSFHEDRRFFKEQTIGGTIIMGRRTYESLGCRALPSRRNCIISRTLRNSTDSNVEIFESLEYALDKYNDAWIIGGAEIYNYALKNRYAERALITVVHKRYNADQFLAKEYLPTLCNVLRSTGAYDIREFILKV